MHCLKSLSMVGYALMLIEIQQFFTLLELLFFLIELNCYFVVNDFFQYTYISSIP